MQRPTRAPWTWPLLLAVAALVYLPWVIGAWISGAPQGDLTRIGAWAERDYGWREPQPAITVRHNQADRAQAQVWVLGDSFSMGNVWQSVWHDRSGQVIHTWGWQGHGCLEAFIDDALAPQQARVRHVVVQTIERHLVDRLATAHACPGARASRIEGPPGTTATHRPDWTLQRGQAPGVGFLGVWPLVDWRHLLQVQANTQRTPAFNPAGISASPPASTLASPATPATPTAVISGDTVNLPLAAPVRLSHARADRLLVYRGDTFTADWTAAQLQAAATRARALQDKVQAAGKTFTLLVVPDKSTVYRDAVPAALRRPQAPVTDAFAAAGVNLLYPAADMAQAAQVMTDFYLPNDTHLSPLGFRWLGEFMAQRAGAPPKPP